MNGNGNREEWGAFKERVGALKKRIGNVENELKIILQSQGHIDGITANLDKNILSLNEEMKVVEIRFEECRNDNDNRIKELYSNISSVKDKAEINRNNLIEVKTNMENFITNSKENKAKAYTMWVLIVGSFLGIFGSIIMKLLGV